jgi:hypothetical protein
MVFNIIKESSRELILANLADKAVDFIMECALRTLLHIFLATIVSLCRTRVLRSVLSKPLHVLSIRRIEVLSLFVLIHCLIAIAIVVLSIIRGIIDLLVGAWHGHVNVLPTTAHLSWPLVRLITHFFN